MNNFTNESLIDLANSHKERYLQGDPFPHIYLDDFFNSNMLEKVLDEFPDLSKIKNARKYSSKKEIKLAGKGEDFFGVETKNLMRFLNSEQFLQFLQVLTGIDELLIGDPYFYGGGQHEIKRGGLLKVHADFNKHPKLDLDRRINVLVYLNKEWKEEYGGHFELWNRDMTSAVKKISPRFNRIAIFSTTDFSYHGHPEPLNCPEDRSRKSLALYYYTTGRPTHEINEGLEAHSTLFKQRIGEQSDKTAFNDRWANVKRLLRIIRRSLFVKNGK